MKDVVTVTHLSGPVVIVGSRLIQRCMVCGEKLFDETSIDYVEALREISRRKYYPIGRIIRIVIDERGKQSWQELEQQQLEGVEDGCIELVEN